MRRDALLILRALLRLGAVMCIKTGQFYVVRVDDLKPILRHCLTESLGAQDLVYLVCPHTQNIVLADVRVSDHPQVCETAEEHRYTLKRSTITGETQHARIGQEVLLHLDPAPYAH